MEKVLISAQNIVKEFKNSGNKNKVIDDITLDIYDGDFTVIMGKSGEIYYSSPNRVIIFYQDANISGNYTKIGQIQDVGGLKDAVENNPVLQGWGNKLVLINYAK